MGLFSGIGSILGLGGGDTNVTQTSQSKTDVTVQVDNNIGLTIDTEPLAQAFEIISSLSVEGQKDIASALNMLGEAGAAEAEQEEKTRTFLTDVWEKSSRFIMAGGLFVGFYLLFLKKG